MKKIILLLLLVFLVCSCSKSVNPKKEWIQIPCEWKYLGDELPFIKVKAYVTEFDSAKIVEYDCCIVNGDTIKTPYTLFPLPHKIFKGLDYTSFIFEKHLSTNCSIEVVILYIKRN